MRAYIPDQEAVSSGKIDVNQRLEKSLLICAKTGHVFVDMG